MDPMEQFWALFNEGRLDDAIALCSGDFEYIDNQNGGHFDAAGFLAAMRQVLEAAPDRHVTITRRFDSANSGVLETIWHGTFSGADQPTTTGLVVVFDTRDGQITRPRLYYG
jgi:steroid delta-isomerase-like uncharacterized protein